MRKLNFLSPQISALGRSHLSTAAEPSSSKSNPPVSSSLEYLLSWISVNYLSVWKNRSFIAEGFFFFSRENCYKKKSFMGICWLPSCLTKSKLYCWRSFSFPRETAVKKLYIFRFFLVCFILLKGCWFIMTILSNWMKRGHLFGLLNVHWSKVEEIF